LPRQSNFAFSKQNYEKSRAEQKKRVSFLCRDRVISLFPSKITKNRGQNKRIFVILHKYSNMKKILYAFWLLLALMALPSYAVMDDEEDDEFTDSTGTDSTTLQKSILEMPNAISPNGDGINDFYRPKKVQNIVEFKGMIFNRWGTCIYTWNDINGYWDGTYRGKYVKDGVYFARIRAKGGDGQVFDIKKDVNVMRRYNQLTGEGNGQQ